MIGVDESGLKDISKGWAEDSVKFCFFISILLDSVMYPAVERASWSTCVQLSLMMLYALILLMCLHFDAWSPHMSWGVPQVHVGGLVGLWMGN